MNAPEASSPAHFQYFPGNYRWSAEMLVVLSTAPFGGAEISEVDRIGRSLRDKVGDDEAWFDAWVAGADLRMQVAQAAEAKGHKLTAASNYLRACFYYQIGDHSRQPKDGIAIASKDKTLRVFTADEGGAQHCQRDYLTLACDTVADWLEDRFKK